MTPAEFIKKWKPVALTERAAAHTHFLDLCKLFEHEDPVSADPTGEWFTFEKGATKTGGGEGFADVWKKNSFAWEYKKKRRDLNAAMDQLVRYAAALENPPLQVVCDTDRFIIRTAWTNTVPKQYEVELDDIAVPEKFALLRAVFHDPERLRPKETRAGFTREAADKFSTIALRLQGRGTPEDVAHFVNQLVFCFFANSVKLLPEGFFLKLLKRAEQKPNRAQDYFNSLFEAMEHGGEYDLTDIAHFNGGLFDGRRALPLDDGDIGLLTAAAALDWSLIDPTIFGTLFERFLDPDKRSQGAHYTDPDKIMMIVEPVILHPLRAEWGQVKARIRPLAEKAAGIIPTSQSPGDRRAADAAARKLRAEASSWRDKFLERLAGVRIRDPACGSGNFLYLALQHVKDLENRVVLECEALGLAPRALSVGPEIVHGIEINGYAAELARTTIWIGDIQWRRRNAIYSEPPPILRKLDAIERRDALMEKQAHGSYAEAEWPPAEFIVGNPPFLGNKKMIAGLDADYVESLRSMYQDRLSGGVDLVTYWFAKAWDSVLSGKTRSVGMVATNSIRHGANRAILRHIVDNGIIFSAYADEEWVVDGAAVRVSLVCFGREAQAESQLDGTTVGKINADLTGRAIDLTKVSPLPENLNVSFVGVILNGEFEVPAPVAREWLREPRNVNGRPNSDVLRPTFNGDDFNGNRDEKWIVDFGSSMAESEASLYERPFQYILEKVKPFRQRLNANGSFAVRAKSEREIWWRHARSRPAMRRRLASLKRYIASPMVSSYRTFDFLHRSYLPDQKLVVFAREDMTFLGILHSQLHLAWTKATCSWIGAGNDITYSNQAVFLTFPFPEGLEPNIPASEYETYPHAQAIAKAAERLDELRNSWLYPPDLVTIELEVVSGYPDRILPRDTQTAITLRTRTLTNLYSQPPQWLTDAHRDLDAAVAAAYGWPADISEEDALAKLLELNLARAGAALEPSLIEEPEDED
jgi:type II restriction/modification system DNA methylase subunit YeeA